MGKIISHKPMVQVIPPIAENSEITVLFRPNILFSDGLNIPAEITAANIFMAANPEKKHKGVKTLAHFDTGAFTTSIDLSLAEALELEATGTCNISTAAGVIPVPTFTVNIGFPNTDLTPFTDLSINSCNLGYNISEPSSPRNFGILIGRDIMSRWNIVWNGPTSTVFIND
jgi:hypothetical protein